MGQLSSSFGNFSVLPHWVGINDPELGEQIINTGMEDFKEQAGDVNHMQRW
jgi:hypothetical protein